MPPQPQGGVYTRVLNRLLLVATMTFFLAAVLAPTASATNYTVNSNPFVASHTLSVSDLWDTYELVLTSGNQVTYTVTVTGTGCAMLLFVKGHGANMQSQYFVSYSQATCVSSYGNTYVEDTQYGTDYTVLIATTQTTDINYTVTITVAPAPALSTAAIIGILIIVVVVVLVVVFLVMRSRRKPAPMEPMSPPPYPGQQPAYPGAAPPPPAYPPQPPPQGPPPYGP